MPDADARGDRFHGTDDDLEPPTPPLTDQVARYLAARHPEPQPPGYLAADLGVAVIDVVQALVELASAGRAQPGPVVDGVQLWVPAGDDLLHAEERVNVEATVARFRELSATAGNPGAATRRLPDDWPRPGEPLSHALNHLAATLTDIQDRIDDLAAKQAEDLGAVLARLPLNPAETEPWTCPECGQATLMPAAEGAPTEADNRPPPATRPDLVIAEATIHVLRTRLHPAAFRGIADSDLAFEIAAAAVKALEGAPTEADATQPPDLPHGTRVRHPRFGPATVSATAWTPDEGYTAQVEWDVDPGGGTKAWVDSTTLTLLIEEGA